MAGTEVESRVSRVTVYMGRALITRKAECTLQAGEHSLVFAGLPWNLESESLQVRGTGEAVLGECVFEIEHLKEDLDAAAAPLLKKKEELLRLMQELEQKQHLLDGEKAFLERIAGFVTTPVPLESGSTPPPPDTSYWKGMISFYREGHAGLDGEKLSNSQEMSDIKRELNRLEAQLQGLGRRETRTRSIAKVGVTKKTLGPLSLELSYVVSGPSWKPLYNLRASGGSESMLLEYDAIVTQATGEDWNGIELRLSTARVNVSGVIPKLDPWRIDFYRPPVPPSPLSAGAPMRKMSAMPGLDGMGIESEMAPAPLEEMRTPELTVEEASVEQAGASVLFAVAGGANIAGDNSEARVTIARGELPAKYSYRAVPKLVELAYLTAEFTNTMKFPVLPGKANIHYDGALVATSALELIMPGQKADASLGVDDGVKVEYRFIKRFRKGEGFRSKRTSEQFEYVISLANNTGREIEMQVYDQFPVSHDNELAVKPVQPEIRGEGSDTVIDDRSKITWSLKLGPSESIELPLTFQVEYPSDRKVTGLG
jgi:uncharacterized protein (TIGR02231 family)